MPGIEAHIAGSEKLSAIYGKWPSFHDSEVIDVHLWRGQLKPGEWDDTNVFPVLTVKLHVFIENPGSHHTLTTLRFADVSDLSMEGFNHQNAILGLSIAVMEPARPVDSGNSPSDFAVQFQEAFGMSAAFRCGHIEVIEAVRCNRDGTMA
jgi:hypothetical protein